MNTVERRIVIAGILILAGITAQILTLYWNHPLAFLAFIFLASPLVFVGMFVYLWSLLSVERPPSD